MKLYNKIVLGILALIIVAATILMALVFIANKVPPTLQGILAGIYVGLLCLTGWLLGAGYLTPGEENIVVDMADKFMHQKGH